MTANPASQPVSLPDDGVVVPLHPEGRVESAVHPADPVADQARQAEENRIFDSVLEQIRGAERGTRLSISGLFQQYAFDMATKRGEALAQVEEQKAYLLYCDAESFPEPIGYWKKQPVPLQPGHRKWILGEGDEQPGQLGEIEVVLKKGALRNAAPEENVKPEEKVYEPVVELASGSRGSVLFLSQAAKLTVPEGVTVINISRYTQDLIDAARNPTKIGKLKHSWMPRLPKLRAPVPPKKVAAPRNFGPTG